jgi:xylan 1,4-beta-xylosidase
VELRLTGVPPSDPGAYRLEYTIDHHSGNAYTAWLGMGSPQPPSAEQIVALQAAAEMPVERREFTTDGNGSARLAVSLARQSVKLIEIVLRAEVRAADRGDRR